MLRSNLMRLCFLAMGFASLSLFNSCIKRKPTSILKHDFGRWDDMNKDPLTWQDTDYADFLKQNPEIKAPYDSEHPRVQRLQAWFDAFHDIVLSVNPSLAAPKPKILLEKTEDLNGYVSSVAVCSEISVKFLGASTEDRADSGAVLGLWGADEGVEIIGSDQDCVEKAPDPSAIQRLLAQSLGENIKCAVVTPATETNKAEIRIDLSCTNEEFKSRVIGFRGTEGIIFTAISNVIVLHDAFFSFDEEEFVAILAHELAHYYRAHGTSSTRKYGYFYEIDQGHNLGGRPEPLAEEHALAKLGEQVKDLGNSFLNLAEVPEQKFHSSIFPLAKFLAHSVKEICDAKACKSTCYSFAEHMDKLPDLAFNIQFRNFPYEPIPDVQEAIDFYREYEKKSAACMSTIKLKPDNQEFVRTMLRTSPIRDLEQNFSVESFQTLGELMSSLSQQSQDLVLKQNKMIMDIFARADASRLGYYTTEQEADEISLELMARLGLSATYAVNAHIRTTQMDGEESILPGFVSYSQCRRAYENNFKDFIPIGDYFGIHHSGCFRAYNLYREAKAHHDAIAGIKASPKIFADINLWKKLQESSKQSTASEQSAQVK